METTLEQTASETAVLAGRTEQPIYDGLDFHERAQLNKKMRYSSQRKTYN